MNHGTSRLILHIDMDYFFAQCEERERPELKGKPVVICVYSGRVGESGAVSTSNYEARKFGIKAGMPIRKAKKLNPDAIFLPVNMELYRSISYEIMELLRGHCNVLEQESVDEAFCDITGKAANFDVAKSRALAIKDDIKRKIGLTCSIGIGPNKLVAKIASDFKKPDGLTVVKNDEVPNFLGPLKVTDLTGVGRKTGDRLAEMGIRTIGELSQLHVDVLRQEFGQTKGQWLNQASKGIDDSPVVENEGTEQIGRIITLKEDTNDPNVVIAAINELSQDVFKKLKLRDLSFRSITFVAISTDFKMHTKSQTLNAPANDLETIITASRGLAKQYLAGSKLKLRRVGVRIANLGIEKEQKTLGEF